ncbi:MAG: ComEC/Rec2 family competence protein [Clostridia bacterium]|nr:ComEC/Rec2 family competence protein [Clostridia bacterium]
MTETSFLKNRPLATVLLFFITGSLVAINLSGTVKLCLSVSLFVFAFVLTVLLAFLRKRSVIAVLCLIALSLPLALSYKRVDEIENSLPTESVEIEGNVTELISKGERFTSVGIYATVDGRDMKIAASRFSLIDVEIGDKICFLGEIKPFSEEEGGFNERSYYFSKGYTAKADIPKEFSVTEGVASGLIYRFSELREYLCSRIRSNVGGDSGELMCALLLGDLSGLGGNVSLSFRRIGISHMIAISGMHMSILCALFALFLYRICKNRYVTTAILIVFIVFYSLLTGLGGSVMRSGIMYIIFLLSFTVGKRFDSPTALMLSVALLFLVDPASVYSAGLLLSFLATLGILFVLEIYRKRGKSTPTSRFAFSVICTLGALAGTAAVSAFLFGTFSTVVLLSNLLFALPMQIYLYMSILAILPLPSLICALFERTGSLIIRATEAMSHGEYTYISMSFAPIKAILVVFTATVFLFLLIPVKKRHTAALFSITLCFTLICHTAIFSERYKETRLYTFDTESASFCVIENGDSSTLIDLTSARTSNGYGISSSLYSSGFTDIDSMVISEYGEATEKRLDTLFSDIKVYSVYLPLPDRNGVEILDKISAVCERHGVEMNLYGGEFALNGTGVRITPHIKGKSFKASSFMLAVNDTKILFTPYGDISDEFLSEADVLLLSRLYETNGICHINALPQSIRTVIYPNRYEHVIISEENRNKEFFVGSAVLGLG